MKQIDVIITGNEMVRFADNIIILDESLEEMEERIDETVLMALAEAEHHCNRPDNSLTGNKHSTRRRFLHPGINMEKNENGDCVIKFEEPLLTISGRTYNSLADYLTEVSSITFDTLTTLIKEAQELSDELNNVQPSLPDIENSPVLDHTKGLGSDFVRHRPNSNISKLHGTLQDALRKELKGKKRAKVIYANPAPKKPYVWEPTQGTSEQAPPAANTYEVTPESRGNNAPPLKEQIRTTATQIPESNSSNFEKYQKRIFQSEGGYVNNPNDPGGPTNKGITISTFERYAKKDLGVEPTLENLKKLTTEQAEIIYKKEFWDKIKGDQIKNASLAYAIYDFYVHSQGNAIIVLQKTLNTEGANLTVDGGLGESTLDAINKADSKKLFDAYKEARKKYLNNLMKTRSSQKDFKKGWKDRVKDIKFEE